MGNLAIIIPPLRGAVYLAKWASAVGSLWNDPSVGGVNNTVLLAHFGYSK